jgi:hypothetical protein
MTSQHHESMKTLISGLNITSYQGILKTALDETERQTIQTLLRDEEVWLRAAYSERRFEAAPKHWSATPIMIVGIGSSPIASARGALRIRPN